MIYDIIAFAYKIERVWNQLRVVLQSAYSNIIIHCSLTFTLSVLCYDITHYTMYILCFKSHRRVVIWIQNISCVSNVIQLTVSNTYDISILNSWWLTRAVLLESRISNSTNNYINYLMSVTLGRHIEQRSSRWSCYKHTDYTR